MVEPMTGMKCDFCDRPATRMVGSMNGTLACDEHAAESVARRSLPRLVCVPDALWDAFEGTLLDCGISLVCTDGGRSFRAALTASVTPPAST